MTQGDPGGPDEMAGTMPDRPTTAGPGPEGAATIPLDAPYAAYRRGLAPEALAYLANKGYEPSFGARPLRRLIQQEVETPLSRLLVQGEAALGDRVTAGVEAGRLLLSVRKGRPVAGG